MERPIERELHSRSQLLPVLLRHLESAERVRVGIARAAGDEEAADFLAKEFSGPWTAAHIDADFADAAEWSRANGCPVIRCG